MARIVAICAVVGILAVSAGCALPQTSPVYGGVLTDNVKGPVGGVDNSVQPTKKGIAEAKSIVLYAFGDASISAAMKNGGITKVHHVDNEVFSVMGFYTTNRTVVYGE